MEKTDNVRKLIGELEYIVGNCYHNKQKRGGFYFRYPESFTRDGKRFYRKGKAYCPKDDEINTMRYETGANHLYIGKALVKVLEYLEDRYDLDFDDLESWVDEEDDPDFM